jgi:acyl-CoA thioesterase-2
MAAAIPNVAALFDLERLDDTRFRSPAPQIGGRRVFGGQVIAQTLIAASRTVEGRLPHSLHAYFILGGEIDQPITYDVERLRDGNSFSTRRVTAQQNGQVIYSTIVSFQIAEDGFTHQMPMPQVAAPETLDDPQSIMAKFGDRLPASLKRFIANERPVELRHTNLDRFLGRANDGPIDVWFRFKFKLPANPLIHRFALAYASDMALVDAALAPHGASVFDADIIAASLDHALWFHRDGQLDDWVLFHQDSPTMGGGRGLARGLMFSRDGRLLASVAQEGMLRRRRST